jgi:hypothetical protein
MYNIPNEPTLVLDHLYENEIRRELVGLPDPVYLKRGELCSWAQVPVIVLAFPVGSSTSDTTIRRLRTALMNISDKQYAFFDQGQIIQGGLEHELLFKRPSITQHEPLITPR